MQPFGRYIRLACVAALVFSGMMVRVDPFVSGDGITVKSDLDSLKRRPENHQHRVEGHHKHQQHQQHQYPQSQQHQGIKVNPHLHKDPLEASRVGKEHYAKSAVKKLKGRVTALNNLHHRRKHRHTKHCRHHLKKKKDHHHHHHRPNKCKEGEGNSKHCEDYGKERDDDGKPRIASFGILVCENKTVSAVFCPTGTQARPSAQMKFSIDLFSAQTIFAMNSGGKPPKPINNGTYSKNIAYLDIISMSAPCPKPANKDITAAIKRLTLHDRKLLRPYFNFGFYMSSISGLSGVDRHNENGGNGDCNGSTGGHWHDRCTGVGTFCGIDIFGCSTIDDGLYSCSAIGSKPTLLEICPLGDCVSRGRASNSSSSCRHGDCECVGSGSICGSEFPTSCGYRQDSIYFCKASGTLPQLIQKCESGICLPGADKCSPRPVPKECLCSKPGPICGSTFAETCKYKNGTLYGCSAAGEPPTTLDVCESNICIAGTGICGNPGPSECQCPRSGQICGSSFPATCGFDAHSLFDCARQGSTPLLLRKCESGSCPANSSSCARNSCLCTKTQSVICGSTFDAKCGLDASALYSCSGENTSPIIFKECSSKSCRTNETQCDPGECECKEAGDTCGSNFPKTCIDISQTDLYTCTSVGSPPVLTTACNSKVCNVGEKNCGVDSCTCTSVGDICGADFPSTCGYDANSLHECLRVGDKPVFSDKCLSGSCVKGSQKCSPDPCACQKDGNFCGKDFPDYCAKDPASTYRCISEGRTPLLQAKCPTNYCPPGRDGACKKDPCLCDSAGNICATSFDRSCNYPTAALMACDKEGGVPSISRTCARGVCNEQSSTCEPGECECLSVGNICGSTFPDKCGYNKKSLYLCKRISSIPEERQICPSGECPAGDRSCKDDVCDCKTSGDICGSSFKQECNKEPDSLYTCSGPGGNPQFLHKCLSGVCRPNATDCDGFDTCKCAQDGMTCGVNFQPSCKYNDNAIYSCVKGEEPVLFKHCVPYTCEAGSGHCTEIEGECLCTEEGNICGSSFDSKCKTIKDALYTCKAKDAVPEFSGVCPSGSCPRGQKKCAILDECICTKVGKICGSTFDAACGFISEALYECKAGEDVPIKVEDCLSRSCISGTDKCADIDKCDCAKAGQLCGSLFDKSCSLDDNRLYFCSNEGEQPKPLPECPSGECLKDQNVCKPDECGCPANVTTICGSTFPDACNLEDGSLYTCLSESVKPIFVANCLSNICIVNATDCAPPPGLCLCKANEQICGSTFDKSCGFDKDAMYFCARKDAIPRLIEECEAKTCHPGDHNCVRPEDCKCKGPGHPCGGEFPDYCGLDKDWMYQCGEKGDEPHKWLKYPPGECKETLNPYNRDPCACPGTGIACGFVLDMAACEKMTIKPNTVYDCTEGELPVEMDTCISPESCVQSSSGAACKRDPCACSDGALVCGKDISSTCALNSDMSYRCKAGKWVEEENCSRGCKSLEGKCVDLCDCAENGLVCGAHFPSSCSLQAGTLYSCEKSRRPKPVRDCLPGICKITEPAGGFSVKAAGDYDDTCGPNPCYCKEGDTLVCNDRFIASCDFYSSSVLSCPGNGGLPIEIEKCTFSSCEAKNGSATCLPSPCQCTGRGLFCGSEYDPVCKLPPDNVYFCSSKDAPPKRTGSCDPQKCIQGSGEAACEPNPCLCSKANSMLCSSDFPPECGLTPNTVYSCLTANGKPEPVQVCSPEKCVQSDDGGRCDKNPCLCNGEIDKICATDFPDSCKYAQGKIYRCSGALVKPEPVSDCKDEFLCTHEDGDVKCHKEVCHCHGSLVGKPVCGFLLPSECLYDRNIIYQCDEEGTDFKPIRDCAPEKCTYLNDDARCANDDCICTDKDDQKELCGNNFALHCKLELESKYTCIKDDLPVKIESCPTGTTCESDLVQGKATCKVEPCICDGTVKSACGDYWPAECSFKRNRIYTCDNNAIANSLPPTETADCKQDTCVQEGDNAKCRVDPCACKTEGELVCGSRLPKTCSLNANTIYECKAGRYEPSKFCSSGCTTVSDVASCLPGPCDCTQEHLGKKTCGHFLNEIGNKCGFEPDSLYVCETAGDPMEKDENCLDKGEVCDYNPLTQESKCMPMKCTCDPGAIEMCGQEFSRGCGFHRGSMYSCADPNNPVESEKCLTGVCVWPPSHCLINPCYCKPRDTLLCGNQFTNSSCGYFDDRVYDCSDPTSPVVKTDCFPSKCVASPAPPHCEENECACKSGQTTVCGKDFPAKCNFAQNAVYICQGTNTPIKDKNCEPDVCVTKNGAGICTPDECKCKAGVQSACAIDFPGRCGFGNDPRQIMFCAAEGDTPTPNILCPTVCLPNVVGQSARCSVDPCRCAQYLAGHTVCPSQFPDTCGMDINKIYNCAAVNDLPTPLDDCASPKKCEVSMDTGVCVTPLDPCKCPAGKITICGSAFPDLCLFDDQTVYNCAGKEGQDPELVTSCAPQACILGGNSSACEPDPCLCSSTRSAICGETLPQGCGYDNDSLYYCTAEGHKPIELVKCQAGGCDPTMSSCKVDPCACTSLRAACGSSFPAECLLEKNSLYKCSTIGDRPVKDTVCPNGCIEGSDECSPPPVNPCLCTDNEKTCGSAFAGSCNTLSDSLYQCAIGELPIKIEDCIAGGCVTGTKACVVDVCKCGDAQSTCGADYADSCNFDKEYIYTCASKGATPVQGTKCGLNLCEVKDNVATCKPDCTCKDTADTCGVDFPSDCNLDKDTLYRCLAPGANPTRKELCRPDACKTGTHQCYKDPCACTSVGQICGKDLCPDLGRDTVYACGTIDGPAIETSTCPTDKCNGGKCDATDCVCTEDGPFCGGNLPCPGLDKDIYYVCSVGKKPYVFEQCKDGQPLSSRCLCNDGNSICSKYFPDECGYEQSQMMACPGGAHTRPVTTKQCGQGRCDITTISCQTSCKCPGTQTMCGKQFDPTCALDPGTIYNCPSDGADPVPDRKCGGAELCDAAGGVGRCLGECKCKDYQPLCGAGLPASCGLEQGSIYRCDYTGADPVSPRACAIPCNPQNGPDECGRVF